MEELKATWKDRYFSYYHNSPGWIDTSQWTEERYEQEIRILEYYIDNAPAVYTI